MVSPVSSSALKQPACRCPSSDITSICWRLQPLVQKPCLLCLSRLFIVLLSSIFRSPSSYHTSNPLDGLPLGVGRILLSLSQRPQGFSPSLSLFFSATYHSTEASCTKEHTVATLSKAPERETEPKEWISNYDKTTYQHLESP